MVSSTSGSGCEPLPPPSDPQLGCPYVFPLSASGASAQPEVCAAARLPPPAIRGYVCAAATPKSPAPAGTWQVWDVKAWHSEGQDESNKGWEGKSLFVAGDWDAAARTQWWGTWEWTGWTSYSWTAEEMAAVWDDVAAEKMQEPAAKKHKAEM